MSWPFGKHGEVALGHREVELDDGDVVERRDRRARRHERARADAAQAEHAVEGRRDHAIRELRAHDVHARLRGIAGRALRVELALGNDLRLGEFLPARELALGLLVSRPRLLEPGELRAAREIDDHVAGAHDVAAVEADLAHRLADLCGQRDRFLGPRRAERLDPVAPLDLPRRWPSRRSLPAPPRPPGRVVAAARQAGRSRDRGQPQANTKNWQFPGRFHPVSHANR